MRRARTDEAGLGQRLLQLFAGWRIGPGRGNARGCPFEEHPSDGVVLLRIIVENALGGADLDRQVVKPLFESVMAAVKSIVKGVGSSTEQAKYRQGHENR